MRLFHFLFLIIALFPSGLNILHAQDERTQSIKILYQDGIEYPLFFDALKSNLELHNVEVELVPQQLMHHLTEEVPEYNLGLYLNSYNNSSPTGLAVYMSDFKFAQSPVLISRFNAIVHEFIDQDVRLDFTDSTNHFDLALNLATGLSLYSIERCDLAEEYLHRAKQGSETVEVNLGYDSLNAYIDFYLGNCAAIQGDLENSRDYFISSIGQCASDSCPKYLASGINLAWTYIQLGQEAEAVKWMDSVLDTAFSGGLYGGNAIVYIQVKRSQLYALAFRYNEAIEEINMAIHNDYTRNPALYVERGQRILLLYEWDRVLADYNYALELDPEYAPAYFHRGVLFYTQGPRENALEDFRRYLELAPDGEYSEQAAQYIAALEAELELLNP